MEESVKYKILIAEDDEDIVELLKIYLENVDYEVVTALDGEAAYKIILTQKVDLAVLDIMMPKMNGYELMKKIREISNIPIIILSAKSQDNDKILGLNIGADDYLTKPFNPLEIIARVNANLRRYYHLKENGEKEDVRQWTVGELTLRESDFSLSKGGESIILTPTEYRIMVLFMKSPGRVFTKAQIYESINGEYFSSYDNTMMVHISKLREKCETDPKNPQYIKTIRGIGYKIEKF